MSTVGPFSETAPRSASKLDRISDDAISRLVDGFYAKVRADDELAPIFATAIADDQWEPHLAKMRDFWSSVMLTSGRYKGNPVAVHMAVAGLEPHLFGWASIAPGQERHGRDHPQTPSPNCAGPSDAHRDRVTPARTQLLGP